MTSDDSNTDLFIKKKYCLPCLCEENFLDMGNTTVMYISYLFAPSGCIDCSIEEPCMIFHDLPIQYCI